MSSRRNLAIVLGAIGILTTITTFLLNDLTVPWKIAVIAIAACVLLSCYCCVVGRAPTEPIVDGGMVDAMAEMMDLKPTNLRVFAYVGNLEEQFLRGLRHPPANFRVRFLVRDNKCKWTFPPSASDQAKRRRGQVDNNLGQLLRHQAYKDYAHRQPGTPASAVMRFYPFEPLARVVVAELEGGSRIGYLGLYRLQKRGDGLDYSGTGRPVLRIKNPDLLDDFVSWFDHYWDEVAKKPE